MTTVVGHVTATSDCMLAIHDVCICTRIVVRLEARTCYLLLEIAALSYVMYMWESDYLMLLSMLSLKNVCLCQYQGTLIKG